MTFAEYAKQVIRMRPQMMPTMRLRWVVTPLDPPVRTLQQWFEAPFSRQGVMIGEWRGIDEWRNVDVGPEHATLGAHTNVPPKPRKPRTT